MDYTVIKKQADIFKAISHETRLAILHLLNSGDQCVNDLVTQLNEKERTGVSKHLAILKNHGIISVKENGVKRIYHLEAPCLINAVNCASELIKSERNCTCG